MSLFLASAANIIVALLALAVGGMGVKLKAVTRRLERLEELLELAGDELED